MDTCFGSEILGKEIAPEYGIQALPQNFLLDPGGKIIAKNLNGVELQKKLATLFYELFSLFYFA